MKKKPTPPPHDGRRNQSVPCQKGERPAVKKLSEAASLILLAVMAWMAWSALHGPNPLSERVATHFDAAGDANAWGSPSGILFLPFLGLLIYSGLSLASRFPSAFNYPVKVTPQNRERLQALALQMVSYIKAETIVLLLWIEHLVLQAMRQGGGNFHPGFMPVFLVLILGTVGIHLAAMIRASRSQQNPSGTLSKN
jgi:hypothetical protein